VGVQSISLFLRLLLRSLGGAEEVEIEVLINDGRGRAIGNSKSS